MAQASIPSAAPLGEHRGSGVLVERFQNMAARVDPAAHFFDGLIELRGFLDRQIEQPRARLMADLQKIGKAGVHDQKRRARLCVRAARWWRPWCPS